MKTVQKRKKKKSRWPRALISAFVLQSCSAAPRIRRTDQLSAHQAATPTRVARHPSMRKTMNSVIRPPLMPRRPGTRQTQVASTRPFSGHISDENLTDLRRGSRRPLAYQRVSASVAVLQLATLKALAPTGQPLYDWRQAERRLNLSRFRDQDRGSTTLLHLQSRHPTAMPLIMTHVARLRIGCWDCRSRPIDQYGGRAEMRLTWCCHLDGTASPGATQLGW